MSRLLGALLFGLVLALHGAQTAAAQPGASVAEALDAPGARDALARVVVAEAANQGDSGQLAVIYTILNRLADRRWGASVDAVLNARSQFEPVMRAGGDWRALPPASPIQRARIDTLITLVLEGRIPDLTSGALYFQNPRIVAARAAAGEVPGRLVHFGGRTPAAVIGDHAFYAEADGARRAPAQVPGPIFVPRPTDGQDQAPPPPGRGLFVLPDGTRR